MIPIQVYIIIGITGVLFSIVASIYFWVKTEKRKAAYEERGRMIAEVNKSAIEASIRERIAEKTATIEAERVKKETKESLDEGKLDYFDKHPFS